MVLTRVCLMKDLLPALLEVQYIHVLQKPVPFLTLDLKTKLITSQSTFRRSLCGMVVYKVLLSKVETDLAFFLTLILFSLPATGQLRNFYSLNKRSFCYETFCSTKNHFEMFG